jgi:hypothetical protein
MIAIIKKLLSKPAYVEDPRIESYREEVRRLSAEIEELRKVKLQRDILQAYIDDDQAVTELFDALDKRERSGINNYQQIALVSMLNAQAQAQQNYGQNTISGVGGLSLFSALYGNRH